MNRQENGLNMKTNTAFHKRFGFLQFPSNDFIQSIQASLVQKKSFFLVKLLSAARRISPVLFCQCCPLYNIIGASSTSLMSSIQRVHVIQGKSSVSVIIDRQLLAHLWWLCIKTENIYFYEPSASHLLQECSYPPI